MEIDLLKNYPKTKREVETIVPLTEEERSLAREFGKDFFDGDRRLGYGGYRYSSRFWQPCIGTIQDWFGIHNESTILDVGCAKGFMLFDFTQIIPGIRVRGVDVSEYAISEAMPAVKDRLTVANAKALPFANKAFDYVFSINTIHNLNARDCFRAVQEIERVNRWGSFIVVDAYETEQEKERMFKWNKTARTILHVDEWKAFFKQAGYTGDYFWFKP